MKSQSKIVFVNPVPRIPTQGRDKQSYTVIDPKTGEMITGPNMFKTMESGVAKEFGFQYNSVTHRLQTGLDISVTNPFYKMDASDVMDKNALSHEWKDVIDDLVKRPEIKKQTLFEIYDNVSPNYYTSEIAGGVTIFNLTKFTKIPENPNFLQSYKIILYDRPNRFTDETPRGRLAIQLIENNSSIAKSRQLMNPNLHLFYISEQHEAEIEKNKKQDIIDNAIAEKVKLQNEGSDFLNYQISVLLTTKSGKSLIQGDASRELVKRKLNEYLRSEDSQMENIDKFTKLINMLKDKEAKERFGVMYLIQQAVNTGIITIREGYYVWNSKSGVPNMYKHNNYDKLVSLLQTELKNWNPEDTTVTNWYGDLYNEVKSKGIWIE